MIKNSLIIQSGGPTAVINNSLVGVIDKINELNISHKIYGAVGGIEGLLKENLKTLDDLSSNDRFKLRFTPGATLGSCRYKVEQKDLKKLEEIFKKYNIHYLFFIGGNGSMNVANMINENFKSINYDLLVIGVPKSIDNDLIGTDHTPGYGSAAKFLSNSLLDINVDMMSYPEISSVTIVETMGRHTGWLAGSSTLVDNLLQDNTQLLVYIPEIPFDINQCLSKIINAHKAKRNTILVVAEGIKDSKGKLVSNDLEYDDLGRPKLGGVSTYLQDIIRNETGIKSRCVIPSILQRSSSINSSKVDIDEAYQLGSYAAVQANEGSGGIMVSLQRRKKEYAISFENTQLKKVVNKEKYVPENWYNNKDNKMTSQFKNYLMPLIQGEIIIPMNKGLTQYQSIR